MTYIMSSKEAHTYGANTRGDAERWFEPSLRCPLSVIPTLALITFWRVILWHTVTLLVCDSRRVQLFEWMKHIIYVMGILFSCPWARRTSSRTFQTIDRNWKKVHWASSYEHSIPKIDVILPQNPENVFEQFNIKKQMYIRFPVTFMSWVSFSPVPECVGHHRELSRPSLEIEKGALSVESRAFHS